MADGDSIAQLAVVVLLLILAVPALATAHEYAGTPFEYTENTTVDEGNDYHVQQNATDAEAYSETVTIIVDGTELTEGDDYEWNASTGVVSWYNTTNAPQDADAQITYEAYQRTPETAMAWTIIAPLMGLFGLFALVAAIRTLWQYTAEVWELT